MKAILCAIVLMASFSIASVNPYPETCPISDCPAPTDCASGKVVMSYMEYGETVCTCDEDESDGTCDQTQGDNLMALLHGLSNTGGNINSCQRLYDVGSVVIADGSACDFTTYELVVALVGTSEEHLMLVGRTVPQLTEAMSVVCPCVCADSSSDDGGDDDTGDDGGDEDTGDDSGDETDTDMGDCSSLYVYVHANLDQFDGEYTRTETVLNGKTVYTDSMGNKLEFTSEIFQFSGVNDQGTYVMMAETTGLQSMNMEVPADKGDWVILEGTSFTQTMVDLYCLDTLPDDQCDVCVTEYMNNGGCADIGTDSNDVAIPEKCYQCEETAYEKCGVARHCDDVSTAQGCATCDGDGLTYVWTGDACANVCTVSYFDEENCVKDERCVWLAMSDGMLNGSCHQLEVNVCCDNYQDNDGNCMDSCPGECAVATNMEGCSICGCAAECDQSAGDEYLNLVDSVTVRGHDSCANLVTDASVCDMTVRAALTAQGMTRYMELVVQNLRGDVDAKVSEICPCDCAAEEESKCCASGWQDGDGKCVDTCPGECPVGSTMDGCSVCMCATENKCCDNYQDNDGNCMDTCPGECPVAMTADGCSLCGCAAQCDESGGDKLISVLAEVNGLDQHFDSCDSLLTHASDLYSQMGIADKDPCLVTMSELLVAHGASEQSVSLLQVEDLSGGAHLVCGCSCAHVDVVMPTEDPDSEDEECDESVANGNLERMERMANKDMGTCASAVAMLKDKAPEGTDVCGILMVDMLTMADINDVAKTAILNSMDMDDMTRSVRDNCPCSCASKQLSWNYVAYVDSNCQNAITTTISGGNPISEKGYKDCFTHLSGLEATLECGDQGVGHIHEVIYSEECGGEVAGTVDFRNGECVAVVVEGQQTSYGVLSWESDNDPCVEPVCCESGWEDGDGKCVDTCPGECPVGVTMDGCSVCMCPVEDPCKCANWQDNDGNCMDSCPGECPVGRTADNCSVCMCSSSGTTAMPEPEETCPPGEEKLCDHLTSSLEMDLMLAKLTDVITLTPGEDAIEVKLTSEVDVDLYLYDGEVCVVGYDCLYNRPGTYTYNGYEVDYSGDARVSPVTETLRVSGVPHTLSVRAKAYANTEGVQVEVTGINCSCQVRTTAEPTKMPSSSKPTGAPTGRPCTDAVGDDVMLTVNNVINQGLVDCASAVPELRATLETEVDVCDMSTNDALELMNLSTVAATIIKNLPGDRDSPINMICPSTCGNCDNWLPPVETSSTSTTESADYCGWCATEYKDAGGCDNLKRTGDLDAELLPSNGCIRCPETIGARCSEDCLSLETLEEQVRCLQEEIDELKSRVDTQCRGDDLQNMIDNGLEDLAALLQCRQE